MALATALTPSLSIAQTNPTGALVPCTGLDCNWCSLVQLIQNLINYAIFLGTMVAALLFMWAGFLYITNGGSSENISKAKKIFLAVAWGFVAILGGWLAVDTLMKALVGGTGSKFGPWNDFRCTTMSQDVKDGTSNPITLGRRGVVGIDGGNGGGGDPYSDVGGSKGVSIKGSAGGIYSPSQHDDQDIRTYLSSNNISFAKGSCSGDATEDCIDMSKVREYVAAQLITFKESCGSDCAVVVSRGNEQISRERGLYTHVNGYMVDIQSNTSVDTYITNTLTKETDSLYTDSCGNNYEKGGSAWSLTIWNKCSY
jgi:hypothetical protein